MRITNFQRDLQDGLVSLSATFHWEDNAREPQTIFIRYGADNSYFEDSLLALPFLIAAVVPALRRGERRIAVEGPGVCHWLVDNLESFMGYLLNWYWYKYDRDPADLWLPRIEAASLSAKLPQRRRTACFYSGGVDSLYCLRRNRLNIPRNDPGSIQDVIFVHGFDMGTRPMRGSEEDFFQSVIDEMQPVLESEGLNLIPVFTNIRTLDKGTDCWLDEYSGSAMSAVAHGLSGRLTDVLVASGVPIPKLQPYSSHPLIEPRLSSYGLRVNHDGELLSRVDRVKMISQWPEALQTLRVCFFGDESRLNCGECSKCIRTKLEFICAGKLEEAVTLPQGEPTSAEIKRNMDIAYESLPFMDSLERELRQVGRGDLAQAVRARVRSYRFARAIDIPDRVKWLDERVLKGALKRNIVARRGNSF